MIYITYGFELPRGVDGKKLKEHRWAKKQREDFNANDKAKYHPFFFFFFF